MSQTVLSSSLEMLALCSTFFCTYTLYIYVSFIFVFLFSFLFTLSDSIDYSSSASLESVVVFVRHASFSFCCFVTEKTQQNEKKRQKKNTKKGKKGKKTKRNRSVGGYARNLAIFLYFRSCGNVGNQKVYEVWVCSGREEGKRTLIFLDKTANSIWCGRCNETRTKEKR